MICYTIKIVVEMHACMHAFFTKTSFDEFTDYWTELA